MKLPIGLLLVFILSWPAIDLGARPPAAQTPASAPQRGPSYVSPNGGDFGTGENFLEMPSVGAHRLRVLTPALLELTWITTQPPKGRPEQGDTASDSGATRPHPLSGQTAAGAGHRDAGKLRV